MFAYIYTDACVALAVGRNLGADGDVAKVDKDMNLTGSPLLLKLLQRESLDILENGVGIERRRARREILEKFGQLHQIILFHPLFIHSGEDH